MMRKMKSRVGWGKAGLQCLKATAISASRATRFAYPESIFDAQIGYGFQDGTTLEGLSITLQALNLTDEPFINYTDGDRTHIVDYEEYGRTYLIGASYRF